MRNFNSWRDKERARCESESVLEEKVANIFGMLSKPYLYHLAGLCTGEDVWGTVVDLGLYTRFLDIRIVIIDTGKIRGDSSDPDLYRSRFPGECEKHRVVCAEGHSNHFDLGAVFCPKARTIFDIGEDWARLASSS